MLALLDEKVHDTNTVNNYYILCWEYQYSDENIAIGYAKKGYDLAKKLKWKNGIRKMAHNRANIHYMRDEYQDAVKYNKESIRLAKEMKMEKALGQAYNNLGLNYDALSKYSDALNSYFSALKYYRITKNENGESSTLGNIGNIYISLSDFDNAKKYHKMSQKRAIEKKDTGAIVNSYVNLGLIDERLDLVDSAIHKYLTAMDLSEKSKYKRAYYSICNNLGAAYNRKGEAELAEKYIMIPYEYYKKNHLEYQFALAAGNLGLNARDNGDYPKAEKYLKETKEFAKRTNATEVEKDAVYFLYDLYKIWKKYDLALVEHEEYMRLLDTLNNMDEQKKIADLEASMKVQNKQIADSLNHIQESKEEQLKHDREIEEQKWFTYAGIGIAMIALVFLGLVYRNFRQKKRANILLEEKNSLIQKQKKDVEIQKLIIEEKHKEISDSINYAERLQRSLMASDQLLNSNLKDYFIYFNPKETVSGDFYWAANLKNGQFLLACADSTGHGVPGAMMSMMNMNSLKEAVKEGLMKPNEILDRTRRIIVETLANDGSEEGGKDGMDAALLSFDFKNMKLDFALANNPLWVIRSNELMEFTPDKMPVGKHDKQNISFTHHDLALQKGDLIIVFTDGYADQFGGEKGKKLKYSGLKTILIENANKELSVLKSKLSASFENWRGELEQVDDVCIIGVKI